MLPAALPLEKRKTQDADLKEKFCYNFASTDPHVCKRGEQRAYAHRLPAKMLRRQLVLKSTFCSLA